MHRQGKPGLGHSRRACAGRPPWPSVHPPPHPPSSGSRAGGRAGAVRLSRGRAANKVTARARRSDGVRRARPDGGEVSEGPRGGGARAAEAGNGRRPSRSPRETGQDGAPSCAAGEAWLPRRPRLPPRSRRGPPPPRRATEQCRRPRPSPRPAALCARDKDPRLSVGITLRPAATRPCTRLSPARPGPPSARSPCALGTSPRSSRLAKLYVRN